MILGVVGGGQLGRMLALAAAPLNIDVVVLDPTPRCPASVAARQIRGSLEDAAALADLAAACDVLTVEIEHTNIHALEAIHAEGVPVRPAPAVLRTVSDKLRQRRVLAAAGLPGPIFAALPGGPDTPGSGSGATELSVEDFRDRFGRTGAVRKARFGGYDGRGVERLDAGGLRTIAGGGTSVPSYLEEPVAIAAEVSVIVARDPQGTVAVYDPLEMVMDPRLNLVDLVVAPARIPHALAMRCEEVARGAAETLGVVGLLAVELFLTDDGGVLINEVAPRPHNSGHLTIEGSATSQFEQHLRAVTGIPLGSTELIRPAVMRNIVAPGDSDESDTGVGPAFLDRDAMNDVLAIEEIHLHLYGKHQARSGRKMGHITATARSIEDALTRIDRASRRLELYRKE